MAIAPGDHSTRKCQCLAATVCLNAYFDPQGEAKVERPALRAALAASFRHERKTEPVPSATYPSWQPRSCVCGHTQRW